MKFSRPTATLLKAIPFLNELNWLSETENTLDLTSIKPIKGCRTTLVQDCLEFIQKLDVLVETASDTKVKAYALANIKMLVEALEQYKISCESHPRLKDFLNFIPDNTSGIVGFMIIVSAFVATAFPPLAAIPLFIFSWVLMDLFFNNRNAAKKLHAILSTLQEELNIIQQRDFLIQTPRSITLSSPRLITPGPSHSSRMYDSVEQLHQADGNMDSLSTNFTPG